MPREYEGDATGAHSFPWTAVLLGRLDDGWGWCRRWCVGACLSVAWCSGWGSYAYVYYGEAAVVSLVLGLGAQRFGDGLTGWLFLPWRDSWRGPTCWSLPIGAFGNGDGADGVSDDGWMVGDDYFAATGGCLMMWGRF